MRLDRLSAAVNRPDGRRGIPLSRGRRGLLGHIVLGLYLGFAPIYWLPAVPVLVVSLVKWVLVGGAVALIWIEAVVSRRLFVPNGVIGLAVASLLFASAFSGLFQTSSDVVANRVLDLLLPIVMTWTAFNLSSSIQDRLRALAIATVIMMVASGLTLASGMIGAPAISSPPAFGGQPLWVAGFGARRTGWSNAIALYLPYSLFIVSRIATRRYIRTVLFYSVAAVFLGAQIITGGRAGLLSSLMVIPVLASRLLPKVGLLVGTALVCLTGVALKDYAVTQFRVDRIIGTDVGYEALNEFSAGRIGMYDVAIDLALERPLFGHGFGEYDFGLFDGEIHNLWLRLWVETGIIFPSLLLAIICIVLGDTMRRGIFVRHKASGKEEEGQERMVISLTLLAGLICSLFEPNALIGSFQVSAIWWVALGFALARNGSHDSTRALWRRNGGLTFTRV